MVKERNRRMNKKEYYENIVEEMIEFIDNNLEPLRNH